MECCHLQAYNRSKQSCCEFDNDKIHKVVEKKDVQCCGKNSNDDLKIYNPSSEECCKTPLSGYKVYNKTTSSCCLGFIGTGLNCCGNQAYNDAGSTCCFNFYIKKGKNVNCFG